VSERKRREKRGEVVAGRGARESGGLVAPRERVVAPLERAARESLRDYS
jgi:hypothetical protein